MKIILFFLILFCSGCKLQNVNLENLNYQSITDILRQKHIIDDKTLHYSQILIDNCTPTPGIAKCCYPFKYGTKICVNGDSTSAISFEYRD